MASTDSGLRRSLGLWSAVLLTVGAMVGTGILATPPLVAAASGSAVVFFGLWLVGGLVSFLGALTYAELGVRAPETGGLYVYLGNALHPLVAFVFGWTMLVVLVPSSAAFFAQVTGGHLAPPIAAATGANEAWLALGLSIATLVLVAAVNVAGGARGGAVLQNVATVLKVAGLGFVVVLGVVLALRTDTPSGDGAPVRAGAVAAEAAAARAAASAPSWLAIVAALVPVFWAYDGWIDITSVAGEVRDPERNIPRSLLWGVVAVAALYLVVSGAFLAALGLAPLAGTDTPALALARTTLGPWGTVVAAAVAAACTFGAGAVGLMSGARVIFAMGRDGSLFSIIGRADRRGSPSVAVAVTSVLALAYLLVPQLGSLAATFVVGAWPFYALGAVALFVLRARDPRGAAVPYRVPGYPLSVIAFILASLGVVGSYAIENPLHTAISFGLVMLGLPVGAVLRALRARRAPPPSPSGFRPPPGSAAPRP